jgi:hypothetical protein
VLFNVARRAVRTGKVLTRVNALVALAGQVRRAASVSQADEERRVAVLCADAHRLVLDHLARLALLAWVVGARTLAGAVDAGRVGRALVIGHALRAARCARDLSGFADSESRLADANGTVVSHLASLVGLAGWRIDRARVLALGDQAVARQVDRTVDVGQAGQVRGRCVWSGRGAVALRVGLTRDLRRAEVAFGTRAARSVENDAAQGVLAARASEAARVETLSVDARLFVGTIVVT